MARERGYCMETLFSYELTMNNYLFDDDGLLKKDKNKSHLRHELEKILSEEDYNMPDLRNVYVAVDVMMICRKLKWKSMKFFKDFAEAFCTEVKKLIKYFATKIDFIFDSYFETSVKLHERLRRYTCDPIDIHSIDDDVDMPTMEDSFWASTHNKILLQSYLRKFILINKEKYWPNIEILCSATKEEICKSSSSARDSLSLSNLQNHEIEEADSRMILHIDHAINENIHSIIVLSCDTDVLVLLLNYYEYFSSKGLEVSNLNIHYFYNQLKILNKTAVNK